MGCTLVIDTSFGSTVGIVGRDPIIETDSRTHVERLQCNIARAVEEAGLTANDIETIVVGIGPAPFTGLRAGIVTAKALAFATGAELVAQNALDPQCEMMAVAMGGNSVFDGVGFLADVPRLVPRDTRKGLGGEGDRGSSALEGYRQLERHVTLCVNDARRKQMYFTLNHGSHTMPGEEADSNRWIAMDIDYPERIAERVNATIAEHDARDGMQYVVDVVGHGAAKYADAWRKLTSLGCVVEGSVLDAGAQGMALFAATALSLSRGLQLHGDALVPRSGSAPVEPLYLRRPDVEVPSPLKHVLGHAGTDKA